MDKLGQLESFLQLGDSLLDAFEKKDIEQVSALNRRRQELVSELFTDVSKHQDWSSYFHLLDQIKVQDAEILKAGRDARGKLLAAGCKIRKGRHGAQSYAEYTTMVVV